MMRLFEKFKISFIIYIALWMLSPNITAQNSPKNTTHSITFQTQFFQIKDDFNYGLVFNGLNLVGRYSMEKVFENSSCIYSPKISFGANYNKGVGLSWGFVPIDLFYGLKINVGEYRQLLIGAYMAANYNWQLYPELQSGHMFWFTAFEIGPQFMFTLPVINRMVRITLSNSLAGFTSRPEPATESYYYSLALSDFIENAHSQLGFGSYELFNHTDLEVQLLRKTDKKLSLAYGFEYYGFYKDPILSFVNHSLNFKWKIGKP